MNDSAFRDNLTPGGHASAIDPGISRVDAWYSIRETAQECRRSVGTIRNLISRHQLPKRSAWLVRRGHRQKVVMLRAPVVEWLRAVTLFGESPSRVAPPR